MNEYPSFGKKLAVYQPCTIYFRKETFSIIGGKLSVLVWDSAEPLLEFLPGIAETPFS